VKKSKIALISVISLLVVIILLMLTFGNYGFLDAHRKYRHNQTLAAQIDSVRAEVKMLEEEIERLRNDTAYILRVARDKGMALPEEKVFRFVQEEEK